MLSDKFSEFELIHCYSFVRKEHQHHQQQQNFYIANEMCNAMKGEKKNGEKINIHILLYLSIFYLMPYLYFMQAC